MAAQIQCRSWFPLTWALVRVVLCIALLGSGPTPAAEEAKPPHAWLVLDNISLPGPYWMLGRPAVREEAGITPEQTEKLKEISRRFADANRQATTGNDWTKLSPDERRQKYTDMLAANKKRTEDTIKQVQDALTVDQRNTFEMIDLRQQVMGFLDFGPVADKLGLSDQQKERIRQNRDECHKKTNELQRQIQKLHDQAGQAALEMLTPAQIEKLKEVRRVEYTGRGTGAAISEKD